VHAGSYCRWRRRTAHIEPISCLACFT
jgi:hypothetical protein